MVGAVLIFLVVVNAFVTGYMLVQLGNVKKTVAGVANVQRRMVVKNDIDDSEEV